MILVAIFRPIYRSSRFFFTISKYFPTSYLLIGVLLKAQHLACPAGVACWSVHRKNYLCRLVANSKKPKHPPRPLFLTSDPKFILRRKPMPRKDLEKSEKILLQKAASCDIHLYITLRVLSHFVAITFDKAPPGKTQSKRLCLLHSGGGFNHCFEVVSLNDDWQLPWPFPLTTRFALNLKKHTSNRNKRQ
jgi:hypothetical protein